MKNKAGYFPQLTGIRAIAAYMVFVHHYVETYKEKLPKLLYAMLSELHIGVTVFFVLSGFLIAYRYMDKVQVSKAWIYQYFKNRVARIYPMYFILTTGAFIYYKSNPDFNISTYLLNITFLRGFFDQYKFTGISQGWSLTVEECFYAIAPVIFLFRKRIKFVLMPLIVLSIAFVLLFLGMNINFHGFFNTPQFVFGYTFFGRCIEFFIGIQLAFFVKRRTAQERKSGLYTFTGLFGIVCCLYFFTFFPKTDTYTGDSFVRIIINNVVCPIYISAIFYGLITELNWFRTFLSTRVMKLLGESSYIFYLIHFGFVYEITCMFIPMFSLRLPVIFVTINMISILLFKLLEHPLNNYIRSHFNGKNAAKPLPTK